MDQYRDNSLGKLRLVYPILFLIWHFLADLPVTVFQKKNMVSITVMFIYTYLQITTTKKRNNLYLQKLVSVEFTAVCEENFYEGDDVRGLLVISM